MGNITRLLESNDGTIIIAGDSEPNTNITSCGSLVRVCASLLILNPLLIMQLVSSGRVHIAEIEFHTDDLECSPDAIVTTDTTSTNQNLPHTSPSTTLTPSPSTTTSPILLHHLVHHLVLLHLLVLLHHLVLLPQCQQQR